MTMAAGGSAIRESIVARVSSSRVAGAARIWHLRGMIKQVSSFPSAGSAVGLRVYRKTETRKPPGSVLSRAAVRRSAPDEFLQ
jgi:hypothetical protein